MDNMNEIESKMQSMEQGEVLAPIPVENTVPAPVTDPHDHAPVDVALDATAATIVTRAQERINSDRIVDKHAKALAKNADARIKNEIERQNVENERKAANNEIDRKTLANALYKIKQESKRLKKEQAHLTAMQKQTHRQQRSAAYWEEHKETLEQYGMKQGSSRVACEILLWLDGVKSFFNGLSKVSDAIVKALKWILIIGGSFAVLMIIPATRNWLLSLLGFVK